ncbi:MAG: MFS transporter [Chromatiales bacterium]|jgi:MFS transporter, FSR family, fosmidomycin resistance protein|nr:MFS transporter [Chromatiales bacterium]
MSSITASSEPAPLAATARTIVFTLVGSGHFMSHLYILSLPPLFALIKADLDISYAALGLMVTMFHVATGISQVPAGFAVDRFGARVTLITGMLLSSVCMGALGIADSYWIMVVLTTLAGIGNSVFHPADYAILAASVQERHLGKAFGFHLLAGNFGFAAAPILMVSLAAWFDWRTALMMVGGAGVVVGIAMMLFGRNLTATRAAKAEPRAPDKSGVRALMSPALLVMLAFFVLIAVANSGVQTFSVTVLNQVYGISLETANTALTVYLTAGFVGVAIGGFIADRLRRPVVVVSASMLVTAMCFGLVSAIALPLAVLLTAMALAGCAVGLMRPARDMMVNAITPVGSTGKAFGFMGTGLSIGGAVAPVVFGWMIDEGSGHWVLAICAALALLSIGSAVIVARLSPRLDNHVESRAVT